MSSEINFDNHKIIQGIAKKLYNSVNQIGITAIFTDEPCEFKENDLSTVTSQEILDKVRDHMRQECDDISNMLFFRYLSAYPVSMCKRDVSKLLSIIIGFHYRMSIPNEAQAKEI